jgi:probable phosphoglycerate mutase
MLPYALHDPAKRLLLIRHGQAGDPTTKRYIGQTQTRLTQTGLSQAETLARWLAPVPLERIVCSDLERCLRTAGIIAGDHGLQPEPEARLREIDLGDWDGKTFSEIRASQPEAFEQRGGNLAGFRPPGGESFADLQIRVMPVLTDIMAEAIGNVAVVGHAGVNRVAFCHWLGLPLSSLFQLGQDQGCLNILEFSFRAFKRVRALNLTLE